MLRSFVLALAAIMLATPIVYAETIIPGGNISGLWSAAGSPYLIQGNITIPDHETLIVEPGVSVIFQGTYGWIVHGWLEAIGTVTDSILITAQDTTARWYGIKFDEAPDSSFLKYCIIEYGKNAPPWGGGGIHCENSNPVINRCTLRYNLGNQGGAICLISSHPRITYNEVIYNGRETITGWGGGILIGGGSSALVAFNNISGNRCWDSGAGLAIGKYSGEIELLGNFFCGNTDTNGGDGGGGFLGDGYLADLHITLSRNIFVDNSSVDRGGGLCTHSVHLDKTVIYHNTTQGAGGGLCNLSGSPSTIKNSIAWSNSPDQFLAHSIQGNYCDVQHGWFGIGNLNSDPMFVAPEYYDFRLQWGSPCIDAGDPNLLNNDPDDTRGDIGAFYYDQSVPVRALLTPHERSIVLPPQGGNFDYTLWLTNIDPSNPEFSFWIDVTLPDGSVFGPVVGPVAAQLDSGVTISRVRSQMVPAGAPEGVYLYNAYAVVGIDTSRDSFSFFKMEPILAGGIVGWNGTGESLDNLGDSDLASSLPLSTSLQQNYPNPFNPVTSITFQLPVTGQVTLGVYDLQGRLVAQLVNGQRAAGVHTVTWDATDFASGLYFCKLEAGSYQAVMKMMLVK